jgi:hypothetical protein
MATGDERPQNTDASAGQIGDLAAAAAARRSADQRLSMSERLARVHSLSKQMSAIKGSARQR